MSLTTAHLPGASRTNEPTEHTFVTADGTPLFYRAWLPEQKATRAVFLFHRGHEHSGRFCDVVDELALPETALFAWDARGHGRSPGSRGAAPSFGCIVKDLDGFVKRICELHNISLNDVIVLGHSVSAVAVAAWVHDYAPPIRAMVLLTPALRVKLYVPFAIPGLRCLQAVRGEGKSFVTSYVRSTMLTHDRAEAKKYDEDPLIAKSIAVNVLLDLHDTSTRLLDDAAAIQTPALVLTAGRTDWVVRLDAQQKFFERLGSADKRLRVFDGLHHDILHEVRRSEVLDEIRQFVVAKFKEPRAQPTLLNADRDGFTKDEHDRLSQPLPVWSPKRWWFAAQVAVMKSIGRLSDGVRLGWQTGFDSGQSLDYVYENRARGRLGLGSIIDRIYLNAVGWRGVRERRQHLQSLLKRAIEQVRAKGQLVRIADIAAGGGRYVLQTLADLPPKTVESVLLRDHNPANLEACRELAAKLSLTTHADIRFEQADAFDEESLSFMEPQPNIVIVSGLYELFPDNERILTSLRGVARAMQSGGLLIYTGQPWHPQIEMIARTLINREGKPWVMRRRTQHELDDLVCSTGFEKCEMEIDRAGIFTVSLARIGASQ